VVGAAGQGGKVAQLTLPPSSIQINDPPEKLGKGGFATVFGGILLRKGKATRAAMKVFDNTKDLTAHEKTELMKKMVVEALVSASARPCPLSTHFPTDLLAAGIPLHFAY
jgi:hypothetical protein